MITITFIKFVSTISHKCREHRRGGALQNLVRGAPKKAAFLRFPMMLGLKIDKNAAINIG